VGRDVNRALAPPGFVAKDRGARISRAVERDAQRSCGGALAGRVSARCGETKMQRRHFIASVGCLAIWPFVARAEHPTHSIVVPGRDTGAASDTWRRFAQVAPDRLAVTRTRNNLDHPGAVPFSKTITERATVETLYQDILALPPMSAGRFDCPRDSGIRYRLDFYAAGASLLSGDYAPTGCRTVNLSNGTVKNASSGSFRADLMQALGFTSDRELLGQPQ
jgi:hypothetical protein